MNLNQEIIKSIFDHGSSSTDIDITWDCAGLNIRQFPKRGDSAIANSIAVLMAKRMSGFS